MNLIQWLQQLLRKKYTSPHTRVQEEEFVILDAKHHIHTREKMKRSKKT